MALNALMPRAHITGHGAAARVSKRTTSSTSKAANGVPLLLLLPTRQEQATPIVRAPILFHFSRNGQALQRCRILAIDPAENRAGKFAASQTEILVDHQDRRSEEVQ